MFLIIETLVKWLRPDGLSRFNPLNQVYVFNMNKEEHKAYLEYKKVLIP